MPTEQQIAAHRAQEKALAALREFLANALRVMRGAGQPEDIPAQAMQAGMAMAEWGQLPEAEASGEAIAEALAALRAQPGADAMDRAVETIVAGALQVAASRLLAQRSMEGRGRTEISHGLIAWAEARR